MPILPAEVLAAAGVSTGRISGVETLGGLSGRTVARVHGPDGSVVVKGPASPPEVAVARRLRGLLERHGVRTPNVFSVVEAADAGTWIIMEHLPTPLPRGRWGADDQVIATLRALHGFPRGAVQNLPGRYRPGWDDGLTAGAAATLGAGGAVLGRLAALAERAQPLFTERCVVSGDPNPLNWRLDGQNRPVLLDLERITVATPALDLAIVLPGLPDKATAAAVISTYGPGAPSVDEVLLAKAWSVIELAAKGVDDVLAGDAIRRIRRDVLSWLTQF